MHQRVFHIPMARADTEHTEPGQVFPAVIGGCRMQPDLCCCLSCLWLCRCLPSLGGGYGCWVNLLKEENCLERVWECLRECKAVLGTYPHPCSFYWLWAVDPVLGAAGLGCCFQSHILVFHPAHPFWLPCFTAFSPICGWWCFSGPAFAGMRTSSASG